MKLFGVIDFTLPKKDGRIGKFVGSYSANRERYAEPWGDRTKFIHFEIGTNQYPEGFHWVEGTGLEYDFGYTPPVEDPIIVETKLTTAKQIDGFELYQKVIGLINSGGGMGTIDDGMTAYQNILLPIRFMLKDGFPEYSLRYLYKTILPAAVFPTALTDTVEAWIKEYAHKYRPSVFPDAASYDVFLGQLETEETI